MIAVDLDGDGDMDLLSINRDDGRVQWYENFLIDSSAAPAVDSSAAPAVAPIATSPGAPGTTTPASPDTGKQHAVFRVRDDCTFHLPRVPSVILSTVTPTSPQTAAT